MQMQTLILTLIQAPTQTLTLILILNGVIYLCSKFSGRAHVSSDVSKEH